MAGGHKIDHARLVIRRQPCVRRQSEDASVLSGMLDSVSMKLEHAADFKRACAASGKDPFEVILTEAHLPDGTWRDILALFADANEPPLVIVTSRVADEHLWAEVLNLGGYDVLAKPFHEQEVRHVLTSAGNQSERYACTSRVG